MRFFAAAFAAIVIFGICADASARYQPPPKRHFLSNESLRRPEQYRKLSSHIKSDRRIELSRRKVVSLKKSSFWNSRPYQFSTPLLSEGKIFVGVDAGYFYSIDTKLKNKIWTYKTDGAIQAEAAVYGSEVFFGDCKANVYALDGATGAERWKSKVDTSVLAQPLVTGDRVYIATMSGRLFALDRGSGVELWHTDAFDDDFGFSVRRAAAPVLRDGLIYVGSSSGMLIAYRETDGRIVWTRQLGDRRSQVFDVDSKPLFVGDKIYVTTADNSLFCIDTVTGRIDWDANAGGSSDPILYGDKMYVSGAGGVAALDPIEGNFIWQQDLEEAGLSSPAAGKDYVAVASTKQRLYLIDSDTGDILFQRYIRGGSYGDLVVANDMLYVLSNSGRIFTFEVKEHSPRKRAKKS